MALSSSSSECRDRGKRTLMDLSASCLHILMESSSSRTIDHSNDTSRSKKKRNIADTDAADQEILHERSLLRRGICEHGRKRSQCKECGGAGICEHGRKRSYCKEAAGSVSRAWPQPLNARSAAGPVFRAWPSALLLQGGGVSICEHGRALSMQGVRRGQHLRAWPCALSMQGVRRGQYL